MNPKPANRAPTARDNRMREGMAALLTHGSERKASEACGIPRITLKRWAESDEGQAILDELRAATPASADGSAATPSADFAGRFAKLKVTLLDTLEEMAAQYLQAVRDRKIAPRDMPVPMGILSDKLQRMGAGGDTGDTGEIVVQVFGGTLSSPAGAPAQGVAVQVTARKGGGGA